MRMVLVLLLGGQLTLGVNGVALADAPKYAAEVKWAQGIVTDYLQATINLSDSEQHASTTPFALLSSELAKSEKEDGLSSMTVRIWTHYTAPELTTTEVAPDGSEVIIHGVLKGKKNAFLDKQYPDAHFTIRVAKESGGGRWSIRFIKVQERRPTQDKGK